MCNLAELGLFLIWSKSFFRPAQLVVAHTFSPFFRHRTRFASFSFDYNANFHFPRTPRGQPGDELLANGYFLLHLPIRAYHIFHCWALPQILILKSRRKFLFSSLDASTPINFYDKRPSPVIEFSASTTIARNAT